MLVGGLGHSKKRVFGVEFDSCSTIPRRIFTFSKTGTQNLGRRVSLDEFDFKVDLEAT